mmetsp:Transcript_5300/g.11599  ORF Transcript_5300/g.11599 Transcript_5300/m.11599 type:complete len:596 (+) Transcript_5300:114-1901(+)
MRSLFPPVAATVLALQSFDVAVHVAGAFQTPLTRVGGFNRGCASRTTSDVSALDPHSTECDGPLRQLRPRRFITSSSPRHSPSPLYATETETDNEKSNAATTIATEDDEKSQNIFSQAYHLYVDYFDRLWEETAVDQRKKVARRRAQDAVLHVKNLSVEGGEKGSDVFNDVDHDTRRKMVEACDSMLAELEIDELKKEIKDKPKKKLIIVDNMSVGAVQKLAVEQSKKEPAITNKQGDLVSDQTESTKALVSMTESEQPAAPAKKKKKKGGRSVLFGLTMGIAVAGWVYSGNYVFTTLFTLMTALGQLEYYRMVMETGVYPARRISVLGACAMFVTALFAPDLHQIVLPVASTWAMIWFLTMRRSVSTIGEIATTFTGMFYLGYIPSFWVRIRQLGGDIVQPTRLAPLVKPLLDRLGQKKLPAFLPKTIQFPITAGANFIFWTWLCIAFSDVGGYFAGRKFGKTKLGAISPAAGKTSPNKTVEGVIGGCAFSMFLATLGAWVQEWPYWFVLGPVHGVSLALLGLVGDLTASMLKRDAGLKDFGDLIPEHGGIMDRVDSYIFTAPYGWIMCGYVIPWLKRFADGRAAAAAAAALVV